MTTQAELPFFHDVEPVSPIRDDTMSVYSLAPTQRRPAVILCHGGPVVEGQDPEPRDWDGFKGYSGMLAASGLVAVTFNHRLYSDKHYPQADQDIAFVVNQVRQLPMVDPDKIGLWFFSGSGVLAAPWLREPPEWLRAVAFNYPVLAAPPDWVGNAEYFNAVAAVDDSPDLPKLLIRVGSEIEFLAHTQEEFIAAAANADTDLEVVELPYAEHAFEHWPYERNARRAADRAVDWLVDTLDDSTSNAS